MIVDLEVFKLFLLVAVRFSGLVISAPVLGSNNFPIIAKIGLIGFFAMLMTPTIAALDQPLPPGPLAFALMAAGELLIGLIIGFVMTMMFAAIQIGGQVMDMQSGFGMMNVFNPALETQFPVFGFFLFILAILYLLGMDGHHMMIRALASTYERIPPGGFAPNDGLALVIAKWSAAMFVDGFIIAAPVAGAMMLAYVTMGLMGRAVPQIHMFVIGFPLTIATSLIVVAFSASLYLAFLDGMFERMFKNVHDLIPGLG